MTRDDRPQRQAPKGFRLVSPTGAERNQTTAPRNLAVAPVIDEFQSDGTIIARVDWPHDDNNLVNWVIYQRPPGGDWQEVYDGRASGENVFEFAACPNGDIYLVNESFTDLMHGILRIEDGTLIHVATETGVDPFVAHCHPTTGDLYYTHALGIISWTFDP